MSENNKPRRDFIKLSAMTLGGVGAASLAIPFISSMNPGKDTLALASTEIDLAPLEEGQSLTVIWSCLLYTSPSPRDGLLSRMPSSA